MGPKKSSKSGSPKSNKGSPKSGSPKSKKGSPKGGLKSVKRWPDNEEDPDEYEITMQAPKGIMLHRMKFTLQSEVLSDIEFVVGPDDYVSSIRANKCILQSRSSVFEEIFRRCDEWKDKESGELAEIRNKYLDEISPVQLIDLTKKKSPGKSGSPGKKKGSPNKKKGSPDKKKKSSPDKKSKSSPSKKRGSPGKDSKGSPKKKSPDKSKSKSTKGGNEDEFNEVFPEDEIYGWDKVRIRDVKAEGFYKLLRYIYYDEIEFTGVISTIRTLYAARKYKYPDLRRACITYLENNICVEHVLKLIHLAFEIKEDRMKFLALQWIVNETYEVLSRQEFVDISHEILDLILHQDVLNIRELELFQRVQHWAAHQCRKNNLQATPMNEKSMLGPTTHSLIRYPAFLPHEFATVAINSGYLKQDEIITILTYFITCRPPNTPYSIYPRRRPCLDLHQLETDSVTFSDETDLTFQGYKIRRCHSFKDLTIPVGVLPPIKNIGVLPKLTRQDSLPGDLNITEDLRFRVIDNMYLLKDLDRENRLFEFAKDHLVLLRKHYR